MPLYKAPLRDMQFVLHEMLQTEQNYQGLRKYQESVNRELIDQYLEAAADFVKMSWRRLTKMVIRKAVI